MLMVTKRRFHDFTFPFTIKNLHTINRDGMLKVCQPFGLTPILRSDNARALADIQRR